MADIHIALSGYQTGSLDTATTLLDDTVPGDGTGSLIKAIHQNGPASAIIQIETILGLGTTLKGNLVDLVARLAVQLDADGKPKDTAGAAFTAGSIVFGGSAGKFAQDNANFFWDDSNNRLGIGTNLPSDTLDVNGTFRVRGSGPHAIGGATGSTDQLRITGTFAERISVGLRTQIQPPANTDGYLFLLAGTIDEAGSGTHADFSGLHLTPPTITAGAAALTNASTVKITGAPSGATNNYALWVDDGTVRLDGVLSWGAVASGTIRTGTSELDFTNATGGSTLARLTNGGILLLGTTVTTGAVAGDYVTQNQGAYRFVNSGGTTSASYHIRSISPTSLELMVPNATDLIQFLFNAGTGGFIRFVQENSGAGIQFHAESSADHSAPGGNNAVLYTKDNGSGKTQLLVRFSTGAAQVIATEP